MRAGCIVQGIVGLGSFETQPGGVSTKRLKSSAHLTPVLLDSGSWLLAPSFLGLATATAFCHARLPNQNSP